MPARIFRAVGKNSPNRPRCVSTIRDLLNRVPPPAGGSTKLIAPGDMKALIEAINNFQQVQLGRVYGYVGPTGRTLPKLNQLAWPIPRTTTLKLPSGKGYKQGDSRWKLINMNTTRSKEYTLWYRGCAMTSVATAFAAKNVRISDKDLVKTIIADKQANSKSRHKQPDYKVSDYGAITPLTLDAWMTANGGQGYTTAKAVDISWKKVANISPKITYRYKTKQWDKRYPSPAQLRALLDQGLLIIAYRPPHHFVLLTGYEGETTFLVWDVGYRINQYDYRRFTQFTVYEDTSAKASPLTPLAY